MFIVGLWGAVSAKGSKIPYIVTENSFSLRSYYLFPLLLLLFVYFSCFHKWEETKKTGYQMALEGIKSKKRRIKQSILSLAGLFFITGFVAWYSVYTMAFLAYLAADKPFFETYKVYTTKAVSNLTEVELQNLSNKETAYIRLKYDAFGKGIWDYGAIVKIEGRTSIFGTIAEKATRLN